MKTLKLMMAAALTMAALGAAAVTTNRVTVTSTAGTSSVAGSLAYYVKNAPKNGNVLEITIPFDTVCLLDEPLEITSEQSIIIRGEEDSEATDLEKMAHKFFPCLGGIALTHTLYATGDNVFQVVGFLRLEDVAVFEDASVEDAGDSCAHSTFFNFGKLELHHASLSLGRSRHYRSGSGFELLYGSSTLIENSVLGVGSAKNSMETLLGADGLLMHAQGGRLTMVNSICMTQVADRGIEISGSDTQSLFVNCDLGGTETVGSCSLKYRNVSTGKHYVVGTRLGCNGNWHFDPHWRWDTEIRDIDQDAPIYQVVCEGSGRPIFRSSAFYNGVIYDGFNKNFGTFLLVDCECDCINCWNTNEDGPSGDQVAGKEQSCAILYPQLNGYISALNAGSRAMGSWRNPTVEMIDSLSLGYVNRGAQIWHDADWRNVVGEDTERFVIRGSAEKAVIRLSEDFLGKPIPAEARPAPFCLQWDEPTLVVNEQGSFPVTASFRFLPRPQSAEALAMTPRPKDYALDIWRTYISAGSFIMGLTSLDDAIAYAREDWRGERKLLGSDGYYHITFADNMKGATIDILNVTGIDEGLKIVIEGNGETLDAHGASGIFLVEGGELVLKNLTLKGARADGPFGESVARPTSPLAGVIEPIEERFMGETYGFSDEYTRRGAAVQVIEDSESGRSGIVTIENCRFEDCLAKEGGAIYLKNNGCSVTVRNSSFVQCGVCDAASGKGGAIAAAGTMGSYGRLTLENVVFAECGGSTARNDAIYLGPQFSAAMRGVVMSGGAHGGIYFDNTKEAAINDSVIAGNGGYDLSGSLGSVQGTNVYYCSRFGELWEADYTEVANPATVIGSTLHEKTVQGVQQAYYDLQVNLPPAPPVMCTVTFASNGGTAVAAQTVAAGGLATRPDDPTLLGFVFDGWYVDKDFKKAYDFATAVNFDLTLYAKWNQPVAKVVVEDGGATLRFVYDAVNYGEKDSQWFSVAEAETIDPVSGFMPWAGCASSVTKVIFDSSFADFKPRHCGGWFWYFSSLASVEGLENLDVSKATSLARMFMGCSSLSSLDLAGFDTSRVTDMRGMFYGCTSLKRIAVGDKFVTTSVTASDGMFYDCTSLKGGSGTAYSSEHVDAEYARIDGGTGAPGYFIIVMAKAVVQNDGKTLRFVYDGENYGTKDTDWFSVAEGETINPTSEDVPWYGKRGTVTKVVFDKSFAVYQPTSVASWFFSFTKLTSVEGVRYWDTSKAKNFYALFARCSGLTTLDIAGLSTAGATSLESFFNGCTSLKTIYVDGNFVVSAGMNSNNMFKDCTSLVGGAGTVFDSGKTNREYAYIDYGTARPGYFTALELRGVAVGTPDGRLVFYYDSESHAREGDVYSVWSAETTYPSPWSGECARFTAVEFTTSFLGCHPTSLSFWFKGFSALEHVNGIANLDTSAASGMVSMFDGCARLTKLDLSGFDTSNVTQMNDMFKNCSSLESIIAGEKFVTTALSQPSSDMFAGCTALVGGAGTTYDANHVDSVYARTDEPAAGSSAAVPGYFTRAVSARAVLADGGTTMRFVYDDAAYGAKGTDWFSVAEAETVDPRSHYKEIPWYGIRKQIAKVVIDPSFRSYRPKQCGGWFYEFTNLTTIEGLANLATSEATSFCRMFASCRSLTELDLSGFETDSVEDAFQMFSTCSSLRTIIALESCTLSRANDSTSMFANCTSLVGGAGTTYDADHVDADYARIDGGTTDPGYFTLTNRFYAVYDADASQLTFYYDAVKRGERVYESVRGSRPWRTRSSATGVVFDGSVAAYRPTSCSQWFSGFARLESVSGLDALDVSAVTVFADMFRRCLALRELDLSGFDTSSATSMSNMFADSTNLTTIIVSDGFTTANLRRAEPTMFAGCTALVGGAGTTYSPERVSSEYARIDGGPSSATPGYFTLNAAPSGGYAAWAAEKGLTGANAAWDAKPDLWGGTWENGFIYTFGEGLADGTLAIMNISFNALGKPVITTTPVIEGHTDFTPAVIGTPTLDNWSLPVVLENKSGDDWTLPVGASANFFRVRLSE